MTADQPRTDALAELHCPGCAGLVEPAYLVREDCPGVGRKTLKGRSL